MNQRKRKRAIARRCDTMAERTANMVLEGPSSILRRVTTPMNDAEVGELVLKRYGMPRENASADDANIVDRANQLLARQPDALVTDSAKAATRDDADETNQGIQ